eukprot:GHRQ01035765.1.p1 GENE.GHRQ01035765.1~~GHRQ01035765.1.p1  ORF type:complete len:146 (+),score=10.98 GHRQ01035765.1:568-1005(+)
MGGDSLRPYLKMQNLFCRDIDRHASPSLVREKLERLCPLGKVVLPIDHNNPGAHIGSAYLNFNTTEEAKKVLAKHRFAIAFNGHHAKLMYSPLDKDRVLGPFSLKFQVIIKVSWQHGAFPVWKAGPCNMSQLCEAAWTGSSSGVG